MRKLYLAITAFAALLISQIGHAIPVIPGATDIASDDGQTYYALMERADGWYVDGYDANGNANGFSLHLNGGSYMTPAEQQYVGLAFDGTTFYGLRNDLTSGLVGTDSYTIAGFNANTGAWDGSAVVLNGGEWVVPTQQVYVGLGVADEGFFGLRNDALLPTGQNPTDTWSNIGFAFDGSWNGFAETLSDTPSTTPFSVQLTYNMSPATSFQSTNIASVPEPGTGLLLGSLFALGLMRRRKLQAS